MKKEQQIERKYSDSYHPFRIPPSIERSQLHRICSQFGSINQDTQNSEYSQNCCPCCNQPERKPIKLMCSLSQIYEVSEPVGYYFSFLKTMILVLLIIMLAVGVYTLVEIINQCNSQSGQCYIVYGIKIPEIHVFFKVPLIILNILVIIFLYLTALYLFFKNAYTHQKILCNNEKPSDYSVLISGIVHDKMDKVAFEGFFRDFSVADILYTYKISSYMKKLSEKSILEAKRDLYCEIQEKNQFQKHQKMIHRIDEKLLHIKNKFIIGQEKALRTDKIIVTFESRTEKERFYELYSMKLSQNIYHTFCGGSPLVICDQPLFIEPLGEPYEIIWENFEYSSKTRYFRILISNLISILILFSSFVGIVFLSKAQKDKDSVGDLVMSILFASLVELVNSILLFTIESLTFWQKRYTKTGEISIMFYKKCAAFFLNTTLLPFCLFLFQLFEPDEEDLIRNILTIFFISNIITPIIGFYINPRYLVTVYKRYKIRKQGKKLRYSVKEKKCLLTQIKCNSIFEKQTFMLDERYALASQLLTNCIFYAAIFPIGIFITIIGMVITYWSSKFWLLKYCSLPKLSFRIGRNINYLCCFLPCIYAFGYAANLYMVKYEVNFNRSYSIYIAVCTIPFSILLAIFGQKIALAYIRNHRSSVLECLSKKSALFSYKNFNPTTFLHSNVGLQKIEKWLKKKEQKMINSFGVGEEDLEKRKELRKNSIWDNLISYAMAKEMGIQIAQDFNQNDFSSESSRKSRLSRNSRGMKRADQ